MELTIALAQYPIGYFESIEDWKKHVENWVQKGVSQKAELLVFPEYGSMELCSLLDAEIQKDLNRQLIEIQHYLETFKTWFQQLAQRFNCTIVAPIFPVQINEKFVNRAFVFSPNAMSYQDKWFMTRFENEEWGICSGEKKLQLFELKGIRFGIQICYDIEFPIGTHVLAKHGAELILAPSCTETLRGATRVHVGARARALEQQIYVGVSQTIGEALWSPAVDLNYGYSAVYSSPDKDQPELGILAQGNANEPNWLVTTLDFQKNRQLKIDGQVFNFKDSQQIEMQLNEPILVEVVKLD
jgi:predicted amidohydrolase